MSRTVSNYDAGADDPFAGLADHVEPVKPPPARLHTDEQVAAIVREHFSDVKFSDGDMTDALRLWANNWIERYEGDFEFLLDMKGRHRLSVGQHRGILNCYRSQVLRAKNTGGAPAETAGVEEDGIYRTPDGTIYKVQIAHHGSGRLYAKKLEVFENWSLETHGKRKAEFVIAPGMVKQLRPEWKLSLEEAQEFGRLYGFCVKCGAILTNEESIAYGIGPVCRAGF